MERNVEEGTAEVGPGPGALHNPSLSTWRVSLPEEFLPNNFEVTPLQQQHATFECGYFNRFDCIGKALVSHIRTQTSSLSLCFSLSIHSLLWALAASRKNISLICCLQESLIKTREQDGN